MRDVGFQMRQGVAIIGWPLPGGLPGLFLLD